MIWATIGIVSDFVESQWRLKEQEFFKRNLRCRCHRWILKVRKKRALNSCNLFWNIAAKALLRVLILLEQIRFALKLTFDYAGVTPLTRVTSLAAKQVCLGPVKHTTEQKVELLCNIFSQPATTRLFVGGQVWRWVVKRITSLFNSCRSSVTRQVARFCCQFYPTFKYGWVHWLY